MTKLLSVIVPVYNVENYLSDCLNSIINNNLKNYEIILIDDGSKDKSGLICDEYKQKFPELVRVFHKKNGGLSSARNYGIKNAIGKYLMFIDSDDKITKFDNSFLFKGDYDIIQYKMLYFYENKKKYVHLRDLIEINDENNVINAINKQIINGTLSISACDKIIKREFVINNNLLFKDGLLSEDVDWSLNLYQYVSSIKVLNNELYIYRQQRKDSITNLISNKIISSNIYIFDKWLNYNYKNDEYKKVFLNYLAYLYCIIITLSNKNNTLKSQNDYLRNKRYILKNNGNYKVKLVNKLFTFFGYNLGVRILKIYLFLKNKGVVKI